jgi:hypothetical protein
MDNQKINGIYTHLPYRTHISYNHSIPSGEVIFSENHFFVKEPHEDLNIWLSKHFFTVRRYTRMDTPEQIVARITTHLPKSVFSNHCQP